METTSSTSFLDIYLRFEANRHLFSFTITLRVWILFTTTRTLRSTLRFFFQIFYKCLQSTNL